MRRIQKIGVITILYIFLFAGACIVYAEPTTTPASDTPAGTSTAAPTETPTPAPTPVVNEIGSIGDFTGKASYTDNSIFEENMAVLIKDLSQNADADSDIQAIRVVEKERDIFSIFELSLQKNGRDVVVTKAMNIRIALQGTLEGYDHISVLQIAPSGVATIVESTVEAGYLKFTTNALGKFALVGDALNPTPPAAVTPSPGATLQNGGNAGIISPSAEGGADASPGAEGVVTPGAFVFWLIITLIIGIWIGIGIGYILWGRYKTKKVNKGLKVIGE